MEAFNLLLEMKLKRRRQRPNLPRTVTQLVAEDGSLVYVVGTAHFSDDSKRDVVKVSGWAVTEPPGGSAGPGGMLTRGAPWPLQTIREVQPDVVVVELCQYRVSMLKMDERTLLREAKEVSLQKLQQAVRQVCTGRGRAVSGNHGGWTRGPERAGVRQGTPCRRCCVSSGGVAVVPGGRRPALMCVPPQNGLMSGLMQMLLLKVSAHITEQLGVAPGGEFREAFKEVGIGRGLGGPRAPHGADPSLCSRPAGCPSVSSTWATGPSRSPSREPSQRCPSGRRSSWPGACASCQIQSGMAWAGSQGPEGTGHARPAPLAQWRPLTLARMTWNAASRRTCWSR